MSMSQIRERMDAPWIRYSEGAKPTIQRIAICGGAGAEFTEAAIAQGADAYLTADCKYHEFQDAAGRIGLVDIDHWISEHHATEIFRDIIAPLGVKCNISKQDKTPILLWQEQKN